MRHRPLPQNVMANASPNDVSVWLLSRKDSSSRPAVWKPEVTQGRRETSFSSNDLHDSGTQSGKTNSR